jgi:hypothetical protein
MMRGLHRRHAARAMSLAAACVLLGAAPSRGDSLQDLLERTSRQVSELVDVVSKVNCAERVLQLRMNDSSSRVDTVQSTFDYMVLLNNVGGDLDLIESRVAANPQKNPRENQPMLLSNGLSLLFLVFHPAYSPGFEFTLGDEDTIAGRTFVTVRFRHIRGTRSPAALAVRGREYALDLAGTAWVDPPSGIIAKIAGGLDGGMDDVGLRKFDFVAEYAPVSFQPTTSAYWLPSRVTADVVSRHQRWRNVHQFTNYRRFAVETKEQTRP